MMQVGYRCHELHPGDPPGVSHSSPERDASFAPVGCVRCALGLLLLMIAPGAMALEPSTALADYGLTHWTTDSGLPQRAVQAIEQTPDGFLWVGTQDGIARFDGEHFRLFDEAVRGGPSILSLASSPDNVLWIGGYNGLVSIRAGPTEAPGYTHEVLADAGNLSMSSIAIDRTGAVWLAGSRRGLQRWDGQRLQQVLPAPVTDGFAGTYVHRSSSGELWLVGVGVGVLRLRNADWETVIAATALAQLPVISLLAAADGTLWLGTDGAGLLHVDPAATISPQLLPGSAGLSIRSLSQDSEGNVWIGTSTEGLLRYADGKLANFAVDNALAHTEINTIREDSFGNLWVGTANGLFRLRDVPITTVAAEFGDFWAVFNHPHSGLWLGATGLLLNVSPAGTIEYRNADLGAGRVLAFAADPDAEEGVWVAVENAGIVQLLDGQVHAIAALSGFAGESVRALYRDQQARTWIGAFGNSSVSYYDASGLHTLSAPQGYSGSGISLFAEGPDGAIWIGTFGDGLFQYKNGHMTRLTSSDGLSSNMVLALHMDQRGGLWVGSEGGNLDYVRKDSVTTISSQQGLTSASILAIGQDAMERLWLCTNRGLFHIDYPSLAAVIDGDSDSIMPIRLDQHDGMRSNECNGGGQASVASSADGHLWFTTALGVIRVDPRYSRHDAKAAIARIENIQIDGLSMAHLPPQGIAPEARRLEVSFAVPSLTAPARIMLQQRMDGLDASWLAAGDARSIGYTGLAAGDYQFQLRTSVDGTHWQTTAPLQIRVRQAFLHSSAFYLLLSALVLGLLAFLHSWRVATLRARSAIVVERHRIAREIHDTMAQGLLGVRMQMELAEQLLSEHAPGAAPVMASIQQTRELARKTLEEVHLFVWNMRIAHEGEVREQIVNLVAAMTRTLPLKFSVSIAEELPPLDAHQVFHLLRILREALLNVIAHAAAKNVAISLSHDPAGLRLIVSDDGRGFAGSEAFDPGNSGLVGMQERAQQLGGSLQVESSAGAGCTITLCLPFLPGRSYHDD